MKTTITREDLCNAIEEVYEDTAEFLDNVRDGCTFRFDVFSTVGDSLEDSTVLILDYDTGWFVSWYKYLHIGRDISSNIPDTATLREFIKLFKESV